MEHLYNVSDAYSPWRNIDSIPNEAPLRNSDMIPDCDNCRSYTACIEKEGLTEVELRVNGLAGIDVYSSAPKSIFHRHIL